MPPPKVQSSVAGRCVSSSIAAVAFALALLPALAAADHFGPVGAARGGGLDWTSWLLVAGAVAAVGLAAWAFFAPDHPDNQGAQPSPDQSKSEPPAR
jgi:hypothetical protein